MRLLLHSTSNKIPPRGEDLKDDAMCNFPVPVTLLLKESLCLGGFADEADSAGPYNMGSLNGEKGFSGGHSSSSELGLEEESGTCNACAPSCSPCVHFEQVASLVTKTNGFSGEACEKKDCNRCSFNDADLSFPRVNSTCNDRHHTSSETSHPLSACLSHESFSENAESEETLRDSNTSEGIKMINNPNLCHNSACNPGSLKAPIFHDEVVSNKLVKQKKSECLGDNIAFICGSDYVKTRASSRNSDADKKNMSYTPGSLDNFSEVEKAAKAHPGSSCLAGSPCDEVNDNNPRRPNRSVNESSQENLCSNKSDLSEISSLRDSCAGAISAKGERSECSEEQVQSSFARADALQIGCQIGDEHNSAESMQADAGISEREKLAEVKTTMVAKEVNLEETTIGSRLAACSDGSQDTEYDVKVCDICGDIGREELLAVCSNCNDGAEHIYCMRVKMDSVPKGDWMCEECMLSKETLKQKQDKIEERVGIYKQPNSLEQGTKALEVEGVEAYKVSTTSLFTSKRPAGSLQAVRKRPFETALKSPGASSSSSKTSMHLSGGHNSSSTRKIVCLPTESSSKSPKLSSQSHVSRGSLSKSKSFSDRSLKKDAHLFEEGDCRSLGFGKGSAASECKRGVQMMSKSMSLQNMRSHGANNGNGNPDIKLLPKFSRGEDLKRSRHAKGQYPIKVEKKPRLANSDLSASMLDKRIASPGKNSLQHSSSSSSHDLKAVKGHKISSDSSFKISGQQGGCVNEEKGKNVNMRRHVEYPAELVPATSTNHSNANVLQDRLPSLRDSSLNASSVQMPSWISSVPQLDCIWRGKFEIQRTGGLAFTSDGIQAHLSTSASNKVVEVVQKLPRKLLLEEVPRLSMWPTQFMNDNPTEENIALYFFAKDLDSYEKSYEKLLERMVKNDLSLKGTFGGIDLLIFTSQILPEKSQRWNNLLFLWGVFRGKRVNCLGQIPAMSAANLPPPRKSSESISASLVSHNTQQTLNSITLLDKQAVTSGGMVQDCETKAPSLEEKPPDLPTSCSQQVGRVDGQMFSTADSSQIEERESKRRPDIDLNHSPQESEDYTADGMDIDNNGVKDINDSVMVKSSFSEMDIGNNNSVKDRNERCSTDMNGKGPSSSGDVKCDGAYDMSIVSSELDSVGNKNRWKSLQQQVLSNDSGKRLHSSVSSPDQVRVARSSSDRGNMPPFFMLMGNKVLGGNSERETSNDTTPSLALSLALPNPKTVPVSNLDLEMKLPNRAEVNTTLSLFGASSDS
ncbi:Zinc finger, PHD-type [Corchorus olitorius]|uniref:Zinc finger, PHD-type n=1 Tax=Corchorus olitorius TaxID=93759 RepID=A0A1R3JED8_9ROSI|nr:Zinc finger, PHD-type [Corchorus olitorius]